MSASIIKRFIDASIDACKDVDALLKAPRTKEDYTHVDIGEGGDHSLLIDIKAEKIFFSYFEPFAAIYSEEYGHHGKGDYLVVLDPIDGSDNLISHFPYFGASMALQYQGETIAAAVCNFANGDFIYRCADEPAMQRKLTGTETKRREQNLFSKVGIFEKSSLYTKIVDKLMINKLKFRSPGAVALSLVYSFDARFMIFIGKNRPFDIEAGLFITQELPRYLSERVIIVAQDEAMLEKVKAIVLEEIR